MYKKERPIILSIIAILEMLAGALTILLGAMFLIITMGILGEEFSATWEEFATSIAGAIFTVLAIGILFVGFLMFLLGYGLWKLNVAAWFVSTILYLIRSTAI